MNSIRSLLKKSVLDLKGSGILTPELDARVLLEHVLSKNHAFILSHPEYLLTKLEHKKFEKIIERRKTGEPVAYITSHKEFYGYDFFVNKNVLVPRPESEWLVETGIAFLSQLSVVSCQLSVLDIGTGSGCIAISLHNSIHNSKFMIHDSIIQIWATDFNNRAVAIAKKNARKLKAKNIVFLNSDLFGNRRIKNKIFNLIIANLPYVPRTKKVLNSQFSILNSIDFEPQAAIFADDNGAAIIKRFLKEARDHTKTGSVILIELDPRNAIDLLEFSRHYYPTATVTLKKDLSGLNRYLTIAIKKTSPDLIDI